MNTFDCHGNFSVSKHLVREENDGYLLFLPEHEQTYLINQTALSIIRRLSNGETFESICNYIMNEYHLSEMVDVQDQVKIFIAELFSLGVIYSDYSSGKQDMHAYISPFISPLEDVFDKGTQCRIFGMP